MKLLTQEEILYIFGNLDKTNEEIGLKLNRTAKSIKHVRNKIAKITDEHVSFVRANAGDMSPREMDIALSLDASSCKIIAAIYDIHLIKSKKHSLSEKEIAVLKKYYPTEGLEKTAERLGVPKHRVRIAASKLELTRHYAYTEAQTEKIISEYLNLVSVHDIAKTHNRTPQAIYNLLYRKEITNPLNTASPYYVSLPERYLIDYFNQRLGNIIPNKMDLENRRYFWRVVGKYEIDIPIYIGDFKFAVEYNGHHWHKDNHSAYELKEKAIRAAGYELFVIDSRDHSNDYYDLSSLDPIADNIIEQILQKTGSR